MAQTIRVAVEDLRKGADTLARFHNRLKDIGGDVNNIARSAHSMNGQFGPKVHFIGAEAWVRAELLSAQLFRWSVWLNTKAAAFEAVDGLTQKAWGGVGSLLGKLRSISLWGSKTSDVNYHSSSLMQPLPWEKVDGWRDVSRMTLEEKLEERKHIQKRIEVLIALGARASLPTPLGYELEKLQARLDELPVINDIPFQTQWNGQNGGNNCVPASLTMAIGFTGKQIDFEEVVRKLEGSRTSEGYINFKQSNEAAANLLGDYGLTTRDVKNMQTLQGHLDNNHPILVLVNNSKYVRGRDIPYPDTPGFTGSPHVIVVTGYEKDSSGRAIAVFVNDPLAVKSNGLGGTIAAPDIGHGVHLRIPIDKFEAAVGAHNWYASAILPSE